MSLFRTITALSTMSLRRQLRFAQRTPWLIGEFQIVKFDFFSFHQHRGVALTLFETH